MDSNQNNINVLAKALLNNNKNFRENLLSLIDSFPSNIPEKIKENLARIEDDCDHLIPLSPLVSKKLEEEQEEWVKSYIADRKHIILKLISKIEAWEKSRQ